MVYIRFPRNASIVVCRLGLDPVDVLRNSVRREKRGGGAMTLELTMAPDSSEILFISKQLSHSGASVDFFSQTKLTLLILERFQISIIT